ncbi:MAG: mechanosensitive ion channel family protein, partial [Muribaculaceae bacterium]|nr:mechanosensitive ion channel family protein [Muribaculaceae bacterium]
RFIFQWLSQHFDDSLAETWSVWITVVAIALIAWLSYVICVRLLSPIVSLLTLKTETTWDDDLLNDNVLKAVSQLAPAILISILLPDNLNAGVKVYEWSVKLTEIYILWAAINLIAVFLKSLQNALDNRHLLQQHNLEVLRQTVVLFVILIGVIIGISILFNRDPIGILTGLGASAAILMLVFRDTILGFVAGIQLTVNKMLGKGDWIVAPKAGVNGEVVEVKLTTIKVRNWDNSIVTIPPYTLVSDSFQNFQAMKQSGARRVSRSVLIDQTTIRFLTPEEIASLQEEGLISPDTEITGDKVVNMTLLRKYMEWYLANYPEILHDGTGRPELTLMARQLQPTPQGVPFELYFFTSRTVWKPFEHLQADIFDHLYAIIPRFHLAVYQSPSSNDFKSPASTLQSEMQKELPL